MKKMVYLENRRYLSSSNDLRKCSEGFPSRITETRLSPSRRISGETAAFQEAYDNAKNKYKIIMHIDVCMYTVHVQYVIQIRA